MCSPPRAWCAPPRTRRRPKGFGFIEFVEPRDAEDALYALDRTVVGGRTITVDMSKESRKTPRDMIKREGACVPCLSSRLWRRAGR